MSCTGFFFDCARRCSLRCIACSYFSCGCARRCSIHRIACISFFHGCVRRCSTRRIACTCFFFCCARRCLTRCIVCSCFFDSCARRCTANSIQSLFCGCAGPLCCFSSQLLHIPLLRPLLLHAAAFLPCCLHRTRNAFSSLQPALSLCLGSHRAYACPLPSSCFRTSHLQPHLQPHLPPRHRASAVPLHACQSLPVAQ